MVVYEFGAFRLDAERLLLYLNGAPVALGPRVVETLLALVERAGEIVSKRELLERVWPSGYIEESNLTQNVYVLRKLLRQHGCDGAIETLARRGYRFTASVRKREASETPTMQRPRWRVATFSGAAALIAAFGFVAWTYGLSHEAPRPVMSTEARLYALGSFYTTIRSQYALQRSVAVFTRAIAANPYGARDYAARAASYALTADNGYGNAARDRALAEADVRRSLALDPKCGRAYGVRGLLALDARDMRAAVGYLTTAVAYAPRDADAHEWYGVALLYEGSTNAAAAQLRLSQQLNPLSIATISWIASIAYLEHRYGDAISYANQGLMVAPSRRNLLITLGLAQEARGQYASAIESFSKYAGACAGCKAEGAALLAYAYARLGQERKARSELTIAQDGIARPADLALALVLTGGDGAGLHEVVRRMTSVDRALLAEDPRFTLLPSSDMRALEQG